MESDMTTKLNLSVKPEALRRRRYVVLGLVILALVSAIFFGPMVRKQEPNYYDPARTALVNARHLFEESLVHEQVMIDQLKMAHEELDSAINRLAKVPDLDPIYQTRIESLRASLLSIENPDRPGDASPEKLQQSYRDLLAQMKAMITDLDNRRR